MNISSVVINVDENFIDNVKEDLSSIKGCEVVASNIEKIVAIISAVSLDEELKIFKDIENLKFVKNVAMIYSYQEDTMKDLNQNTIHTFLNDDMDVKFIQYSGDLHKNV